MPIPPLDHLSDAYPPSTFLANSSTDSYIISPLTFLLLFLYKETQRAKPLAESHAFERFKKSFYPKKINGGMWLKVNYMK